ncbi:MAG TPA: MBL fold metallo-hydrolase [Rhizobiaceae bacterium]|nr:MBL fold metallo-hydrolase [Rhizobiaceae bacterium]
MRKQLLPLIACAFLGGCATVAGPPTRATIPEPLKSAGVIANAAGTVLGVHDERGAPTTRPLAPNITDPSITWLGHSSLLIRLGGKVLMTDPIFSPSLAYHSLLKPKRLAGPPPGLEKLQRLDAILISHLDHDHFDLPTLRDLARRFPKARLLVPEGTLATARRAGFSDTVTFSVWDTTAIGGLQLTALPAMHYGRRDVAGFVRSRAIGWDISSGGRKIYFSGDTAWSTIFGDIRARRGRFDYALVPIGAYAPEPVMADVHVNPEDALMAASILGARFAIGHHWGTFNLGAESPAEAKARFHAARAPGIVALTPDIGETIRLK